MMVHLKLAWRHIRQASGRALLTTLSIVIGVAAVLAVSFTTQTTRQSFAEVFQLITGRADLEVSGPFGTSIDEHLVEKLSNVPGIRAAVPLIKRYTVMYIGKRRVELTALGIDPQRDAAIHDYQIVAGKSLTEANGVLLNDTIAQNVGANLHDSVDLLTRRGIVKTHVVGLYSSRMAATSGQGAVLLMQLRAAQYLFKSPGKCDSIQIVLQPRTNLATVEKLIAAQLPKSVSVHQPAARSSIAEQTSLSTEMGLKMARVFALVVALFIIANTFLMSVTQRKRSLGIMRAIGATRRQITVLVLSEALLLGVAGTAIGCGLGLLLAQYLIHAMGMLYRTTLPPLELEPQPFLFAAAFGMGISLLGAAMPARKASHLTPLEAMRDVLPDEIHDMSRQFVVVGGALLVLSSALMTVTILGWLPAVGVVWEAVALLVGLVLLLPMMLGPLSWLVSAVLSPWLRIEGHLARQQLLRHRTRTTLTTGVVFIAISTGIGLATAVTDNVQDVKNWYHKALEADFFVRAMEPDLATGLAADLPDQVDPEIRKIPGIESIEAVRMVHVQSAGRPVVLVARDFLNEGELDLDIVAGEASAVRNRLHEGEAVIGSVFAEQTKLKVGDETSVNLDNHQQKFRIAAIANDYQAGGMTIYIDRHVAQRLLGIEGVDGYMINADHARFDEVRRGLQALCKKYGLLLQSISDIQRTIDSMISGVVAGLWGLVVLGLVVAAFGVANTLAMSVLEQTREVALLRVVAMTRWQVRKSILTQGLTIGLLALVPGVAAGVGVAYLIHWATLPVIGHPVPLAIHPSLLVGGLVVGLLVVAAAAWIPAERAARIDLSLALRYS